MAKRSTTSATAAKSIARKGSRAETQLRRLCMALPNAKETVSHGAPTLWSPKRTVAVFADGSTHHGHGRHAAWIKAAPGRQARMIRTAPDRFFVPPCVGVSGWIGVWLDGVCNWEELADILTSAQELAQGKGTTLKRMKVPQ